MSGPKHSAVRRELGCALAGLLTAEDLSAEQCQMPRDEEIKQELPEQKVC